MNSDFDEKTRLLIGSLIAAVVLVAGYGLYQMMNPEPLPPPSVPVASEASAPAQGTEPGAPSVTLQMESQVVAGSKGHQASASGDDGLQYVWSIQGGSLDEGANSPAVTWNAGNGREAVLTCRATNAAGKATAVSQRVVLLQPPTIARFEVYPDAITAGGSAKLSWSAANADKLSLSPDGQDLSQYSGPNLEVKPQESTTYVLTASNATGVTVTREVKLKVVAAPEILGLKSDPESGSNSVVTVTGQFKGGKAELMNGDEVLASSETSPLSFRWTNAKEGTSLTFKVTNEAGAFSSSSLVFSMQRK